MLVDDWEVFDVPVLHEFCGFFHSDVLIDDYERVSVDHAGDDGSERCACFDGSDEDVFDGYDTGWFAALDDEDCIFVELVHGCDYFLDGCVVVDDFNVFGHDVFYEDIACHSIFTYIGMTKAIVIYTFYVYYAAVQHLKARSKSFLK